MLQNGNTGVRPLNLAFVQQGVTPYEIIRRPYPATESPTSNTGSSRLYNLAQIRILLDDNPANLPLGPQPGDRQIDFYPNATAVGALGAGLTPMAQGVQAPPAQICLDAKKKPIACSDPAWVNRVGGATNAPWPLISGWLRVEYRDAAGQYHNITQEWLNLGFARQAQAGGPTPNLEAGIANTVHPNAILLLQYPFPPDPTNLIDPPRFAPTAPQ